MSQPLPEAQTYVPLDYAPPRPSSVTVISIIGIVMAALSLIICLPISIVPFFVPAMLEQNPGLAAVKKDTALFAFSLAGFGLGMVLAFVLLAGSIGSLKLMKWARPTMIAYAALSIIMTIVNIAAQFLFIFPVTLSPQNMPPGTPPNAMGMIKAITYGSTFFGVIIILVLPVLILIFFNKRHVVDAFERRLSL
jgi:hypothetical protein